MDEFRRFLNKYKSFRNLSDIYKTDKFLRLYYKIYEYMMSISKEEIESWVYERKGGYVYVLYRYIECFLKAKDFNNWRYRVYELMTNKINVNSYRKYELLYNSKAEEFFDRFRSKRENTFIERFGVKNPFQNEEVKKKIKKRNLERRGVEYAAQSEEVKAKYRSTSIERYGVDNYAKTDECKEKTKSTNNERYNVPCTLLLDKCRDNIKNIFHSNIADEFCMSLYNKLSDEMKSYAIFYKKDNKEYMLRDKDRIFYFDFTISSECVKVVVEFDGIYWHGLMEGQKFVRDIPVEDIWNRDRDKQRLAEDNGFRVIRVREDEYLEDKEGCIERVLKEIMKNED